MSHRVAINEKFNTQNLMVFCEINEQAKAKAENMINYYENSKDKKPPSVIPYMKRKDVRLRLEKLMMEWQNDMKFLSLNFPDNILHLENLSPVDISGQILIKISGSSQIQVSPKCFVILPIGIPGMGKSSLIPYLEQFCSQNEYILTVISPDTIRKSENLSEHFDFSNKETRKCLFNQLKTAITSNNNRQMIYIDKNHSPNSLEMMMNRIKRFSFVKIIGM